MTTAAKPEGYETKSGDYFQLVRPEMFPFIPADCKRVLDVGCSSGGFGQSLKQARGVEVWGVEPVAAAAAVAATRLDRVFESPFVPELDLPAKSFDCVIYNDVLEHLFDPTAALVLGRKLLRPGGCIVASIPNVRHFPVLWALLVRGEWTYRDYGTLDRTHLRFFTRKSIRALFQGAGFPAPRIEGINPYISHFPEIAPRWRYYLMLNALLAGTLHDLRYLQFAVVARADSAPA